MYVFFPTILSFSIIILKFMHVVECIDSSSLLLLSDVPIYGHITLCSPGDRHFFFPVWDYLSKVTMNIHVQISVWAYVFVLLGTEK